MSKYIGHEVELKSTGERGVVNYWDNSLKLYSVRLSDANAIDKFCFRTDLIFDPPEANSILNEVVDAIEAKRIKVDDVSEDNTQEEKSEARATAIPVVNEAANTLSLTEADAEGRWGRVVIQWDVIKDLPVVTMGTLLRYFFPLNVKTMGEGGTYCMLGISPLFRPMKEAGKEIHMKDVPFYQLEQVEGTGNIIAREMKIERQVIQKPSKEDIKKFS